ncbi:uncharacterized protein [Amphiura filiformis]|uniref:uncharacterized protein n=1 Tax=Amphiura filiformis TaxID=82378 RepID=UPI003B210CFF
MQVHVVILAWLATVCLMSCYHTACATNLYDTDRQQILDSLESLGILQEPTNDDTLLYTADDAYSKRASHDTTRRFSVCYDPIKFKWRRCRLSSRRERDRKSLSSDITQFTSLQELLHRRQRRSIAHRPRLVL